jgi:CNT family concentrative nucleoside transporter
MDVLRGILGMIVLVAICYVLSVKRRDVDWKLVGGGLAMQIVLAILILKVPLVYTMFNGIADAFVALLNFTEAGATFVFGSWPDDAFIQATDYTASPPSKILYKVGFVFAFKVLPTVVFFSAFSAVLYYLGILQRIIFGFAWLMSKVMNLSGAESIAAAANVFIGQTEAPLVIKPYLENMNKSEIMCLMTGGMATIAGGVFALFVSLLGEEYAVHFLTASIISAPAAIVAAKLLFPQTRDVDLNRSVEVPKDKLGTNLLDAISLGTTDGVKLAVNVGAMLLVFISLVAFVNAILFWSGGLFGINDNILASTGGRFSGLSLEYALGMLFSPIAWVMGVDTNDIMLVGQLLGKKTAINEVVAYVDMSMMLEADPLAISEKSKIIATYALCGFSNFSSIGIQIGGISAIAPGQRETLTSLGIKALIGGTIACLMTATVAGMLYQL